MNSLYYFYKQSLFLMSLITEAISITSSSFLTTYSGHSISACWILKFLLLRALGPSCIARKIRLWRSPSKPSSSSEVRNIVVQGIFGSSLTYFSHDWLSLKRALSRLSTLFRTAFRSFFPPHLLGNITKNRLYHYKTRTFSLIWVLNSKAVTAIQLFILN